MVFLGSSPTSVANMLMDSIHCMDGKECDVLGLEELVEHLPEVIADQKKRGIVPGSPDDQLVEMLRRVRIGPLEMQRYGHMDPNRNYTRNLIASDYKTFTLLLLCWSPNKSSPIHDHPCDGCWMRVIQGSVRECRYRERANDKSLECIKDESFTLGGVVFINDSMGFHKVGNDGNDMAVTLHLYSPPFQACRTWLDPQKKACTTQVCYYSAHGHAV